MNFTPNERFSELLEFLKTGKIDVQQRSADTPQYKLFIKDFPVAKLTSLTLDQYCIGTGNKNSFCWWIERGLQPVLGRYMPGTSRGHILYRMKNGTIYKNRFLENLTAEEALQYTLKIQAAIANAKPTEDLRWIDDDQAIYKRAGVKPLVTIGDGRKLRLLSCYHPDDTLPISSSDHLGHFLMIFGFPETEMPSVKQPVARMLFLYELFDKARKQILGLTTSAFMEALYSKELGIAPPSREKRDEKDVDDDGEATETGNDIGSQAEVNLILYGPSGTGKTFATIDEALKIIDPIFYDENSGTRRLLKKRFDELVAAQQVRFVTFHQSFSYEDFVEGLRAVTNDEKQLEYRVEPGVFKRLCDDARTQGAQPGSDIRSNPRIWKISINGTGPSPTLSYCLEHGEARIGWGKTGDLRQTLELEGNVYYESLGTGDHGTLRYFAEEIVPGDILLCIHSAESINAVGVVTGDYRYDKTPPQAVLSNYNHVRPVNWLYRDLKLPILPLNDDKQFVAKTVYVLDRFTWGDLVAYLEQSGAKPTVPGVVVAEHKPHVLIIDEINRGNISRILGELISLIEPSKRAGADEALEVTLPYSKKPFSVPSNVYLIGTMNTADRSLASLDIALRRRFTFKEMPPKPENLDGINIEGVNIGELLLKMNERIEVLLDRDHCLGHAYFMTLKDNDPLEDLAFIFRQQIMPLLQEYFFEDWERIAWVLNDQCKSPELAFVQKAAANLDSLFGTDTARNLQNADRRWRINEKAFGNIESYLGILGATA